MACRPGGVEVAGFGTGGSSPSAEATCSESDDTKVVRLYKHGSDRKFQRFKWRGFFKEQHLTMKC